LYYIESESFPAGPVVRGRKSGKWENPWVGAEGMNPQSQTGVALANGN